MVFAHYRQLVSETQAKEWFSIVPPEGWKNIAPMPAEFSGSQPAAVQANPPAAAANA